MTERYLDLHDIAQLADVTDGSIRQYHKDASARRRNGNPRAGDLPAPDAIIGTRADRAHPGWRLATIRAWLDSRPRANSKPTGLKPGAAYHMGDGLWIVIVRITPGTLWGVEKYEMDEHQTMRSYRKYPIFTAPGGKFVTIGERGRAEDNGQGWDIQPEEFEPCPPTLVLDEQDLHMPETAYSRG